MDNDDLTSIMHFSHEQDGVTTSKSLLNKQCWHEYLQEFLFFLEGIGYIDVRKKVAIDPGVFTSDDLGWYGATFNAEETEVPINTEAAELSPDNASAYDGANKGWVTWDGNLEGDELPYGLTPDTYVNYEVRDGSIYGRLASELNWYHSGSSDDILAYEVV